MSLSQGFLLRWARWMRAHGRLVLAAWLIAVIVAMAAAHSAGTRYSNNLSLGGTDSQRATNVLQRQFPSQAGDTDQIVLHVTAGMVCVFLSFVLGDMRVVKLFGLSLATAVFLDAFVVRSLLLPSVLALAGERTWRLPRSLERRLPRIGIEAPAQRGEGGRLRPRPELAEDPV